MEGPAWQRPLYATKPDLQLLREAQLDHTMQASLVGRWEHVIGKVMCAYFQADSWLVRPSPYPNFLLFLQMDVKDSMAPEDSGLVRL